MINAKQLIDNAILKLDDGDKVEILCSTREANSLKVRLHREIKKLASSNRVLSESLWVSMHKVEGGVDEVTITVGRNLIVEDQVKIKITKADGTIVPFQSIFNTEGDEYDATRMRSLMKQDGMGEKEIEAILGKEKL